ncbi:MAG: DNA primase [Gemmatales bacterium]|nr:DNA primase [Gemmatales bacterium]MDW8388362.1 DNA primase [Gemmatales bacterium]
MADDQVSMVKQANDIVEVIGEYLPLKKRGRTYLGLCPFHDDHHPSFSVDPTRQIFRCWACGKAGDVIAFVQERERLGFREALELLARRANIPLRRSRSPGEQNERLRLFDLMKWAEERYHHFLLTAPEAEAARDYLAQRGLTLDTIRRFGLGYAPESWSWLASQGERAGWPDDLLVTVGLTARRDSDGSCYDRFRDRVMFPIRDVRGRTVGFGGRILPSSPNASTAPKYYNSADTPLFTKSDHLYGLDQARSAGEKEGYLAIVEGYTDVLMAHQMGIQHVVATLGTALNVRHIVQLRRYVPRVVLVFDADAGGERGVDRALELFVSQDVDLAVATLPTDLDPCDLLLRHGPDAFRDILRRAVDALDYKLDREMTPDRLATVSGQQRALDNVLSILAAAPEMPGQQGTVRRDLILTRIAQRVRMDLRSVWNRYRELVRQRRKSSEKPQAIPASTPETSPRSAKADPAEVQLLQVLLAEPALVGRALAGVRLDDLRHPGLRRLLEIQYGLHAEGIEPSVDQLRLRLDDNPPLAAAALRLQVQGLDVPDRPAVLDQLMQTFKRRREKLLAGRLQGQLQSIPSDAPVPVELLRKLQEIAEEP